MKTARTNLLLLVLSLVSLTFGIYGFMFGGASPTYQHHANAAIEVDLDGTPDSKPIPPETGEAARTATPTPTTATARGPEQPVPTDATVDAEQPRWDGRITGKVLDRHGNAVEGADIAAVDIDLREAAYPDFTASPEEVEATLATLSSTMRKGVRRAVTRADGRFTLTGLNPMGLFEVSARHPDHGADSHWEVRCGNDITLRFDAVGILHVRVLDDAGNPLQRITVRHSSDDSSSWGSRAGRDGYYHVEWYEWAESVNFSKRGYQTSREFTRDDLGKDAIEVRLRNAFSLTGIVTDLQGRPIPGANVRILSGKTVDGEEMNFETVTWDRGVGTARNGRYVFDSLSPGTYEVQAFAAPGDHSTPVRQQLSIHADTVLDFTIEPGAHLLVQAQDGAGEPVMDCYVRIADAAGRWLNYLNLPPDKPGVSEFIGLPRSELNVTVSGEGFSPVTKQVNLASGDGSLVVSLQAGAMVNGRLVDADGNRAINMRTRWTPAGKDPGAEADVWGYAWDGTFEVGPLTPGAWIVDVFLNGFLSEKVMSQTVQLAAGDCDLELLVASTRKLRVNATAASGAMPDWISIYLQREGSEDWESFEIDDPQTSNGLTIPALPPGRYLIYAESDSTVSGTKVFEMKDEPVQVDLAMGKPDCVRITNVSSGSNAALHGVKTGDLIVEYDLQPVPSLAELVRLTKLADGRHDVALIVVRNGESLELKVNGGLLGVSGEAARK